MIGIYIFIGAVFVLILTLIGGYNSLVRLKNQVRNAWSQVDVQLKRRHELIPNLVESVKGFMSHEKDVLENITIYRSKAVKAQGLEEKLQAEQELGNALGRFNIVVENYPDLKANQNFLALQEELASTENKIAFARQAYNDQVLFLNNKIEVFPSNIIATLFGFSQAAYFQIQDPKEREAPRVRFS
jgi:LemA protein